MNEREAKEKVVNAGIRLVESGLIARTWGNVSCRISDTHFVITPSGRDYLTLTPDEIVTVAIADLSYTGDIKPSGEKGVHAEIYKASTKADFIIHTHQEYASVISTLGVDSILIKDSYPLLGNKIICASYGLPGTKKLRTGVANALDKSVGNAIIMKNHGAVCFGKDDMEAFLVASNLEQACQEFLEERFVKIDQAKKFEAERLYQHALSKLSKPWSGSSYEFKQPYCHSERVGEGFLLHTKDNQSILIKDGIVSKEHPAEAVIHSEIYSKNSDINYIIHADAPNILAISKANITLYPLVDDFAQIVGTKVKTVIESPSKIAEALKGSAAVLIGNHGALC
ncbi:MAG: class II aldolase/adducin family protein, partial [Clostridiales bacterium]|nr:class II aldolase/adducin family protein [Clostridiales bacterium]